MIKTDVLVIGAGPSGTIAAALIKKAGFDVRIVEKVSFPRFVIGESLLPRCMEALEEAELLEAVTAQGFQEKFGAKIIWKDQIFDINFSEAHTQGKTWTWQVPRADFDKTLADECEQKGIPVSYQTEVTDIKIHDDESSTTIVRKVDGSTEQISARFIVDGSGYGRVIPRMFNLEKQSHQPPRQTIFSHFEDRNRSRAGKEPNRIEIHIYDEKTWIWCIPFSNGRISIGFVGNPEFFENLPGKDLDENLRYLISTYPELQERFSDCPMTMEAGTIKSWSVTTDKFFGKGFVLTGNVTEFLDPVFSSGVTLACVSAQNASRAVIRKLQGHDVDWQKEYMDWCTKGVNVFRAFVDGWYNGDLHTIFFAKQPHENLKKQISSILAGYVWDDTNPFVNQPEKYVTKLASFLRDRPSNAVSEENKVNV